MANTSFGLVRKSINELENVAFQDKNRLKSKDFEFYVDRYFQVVNALPGIKKNDIVLDVGLSSGFLSYIITRSFNLNKLYTLEHPVIYSKYKKNFKSFLKSKNIDIKAVDLTQKRFPWKGKSFDYVICSETLEHLLPTCIPDVFDEFNRLLKKGGYLIVTTPNISSFLKRLNLFIFGKNPQDLDLRSVDGSVYGHIREYTASELSFLLRNSGFEVCKIKYISIDGARSIFTKVEKILSFIFSSLGNGIIIKAKKP